MTVILDVDSSVFDYKNDKISIEVDGTTIEECLNHLVQLKPDLSKCILEERGGLLNNVYFKFHGDLLYSDHLMKQVTSGEKIEIFKYIGSG